MQLYANEPGFVQHREHVLNRAALKSSGGVASRGVTYKVKC